MRPDLRHNRIRQVQHDLKRQEAEQRSRIQTAALVLCIALCVALLIIATPRLPRVRSMITVPHAYADTSASKHASCAIRWQWPIDAGSHAEPAIKRQFEKPPSPWLAGHRGIDIHIEPEQPVYAPAKGSIRYAGIIAGMPTVSLLHTNGLVSSYQPVQLDPALRIGDTINQHDRIGTVTEALTDAKHCEQCLHWGVFKPTQPPQYRNPVQLVHPQTIVLKPMR